MGNSSENLERMSTKRRNGQIFDVDEEMVFLISCINSGEISEVHTEQVIQDLKERGFSVEVRMKYVRKIYALSLMSLF